MTPRKRGRTIHVRFPCTACDADVDREMTIHPEPWQQVAVIRGVPCPRCGNRYAVRVPLSEAVERTMREAQEG